ncbi:hypothetical protein E4U41_007465 [Claviceps citrina]|nr:hypothetical protein E4U41_007465 [Claviceps citrina]
MAIASEGVVRCAEQDSYHPAPSFPLIEIDLPRRTCLGPAMELRPSYEHVDPSQLTREEYRIITQDAKQLAFDHALHWAYDNRHVAQAIVDFLYLGPTSTIRNREFLAGQGITMMVVVQDLRMAGTIRCVDQASNELNIPAEYVRVGGVSNLIQALPKIIGLINHHLLSVHRSRSMAGADQGRTRRGKVLITCASGNDYSAAIAAAYIMSVFGQGVVSALQFVLLQRLSCNFAEDVKRMLQTWEEITRARSMTGHQSQPSQEAQAPSLLDLEAGAQIAGGAPTLVATSRPKRGFDDMMED